MRAIVVGSFQYIHSQEQEQVAGGGFRLGKIRYSNTEVLVVNTLLKGRRCE